MVDISKFISTPKIEALLITYNDIFQHEASVDKFGKEYRKLSAVAIIDVDDMNNLGVSEGDNVEISNEHGSIVVVVKKDDEKHEGLIFMPGSFYSNCLMSPKTNGTGFIDSKKVNVSVSKSDEGIVDVMDFL